MNVYWLIQFRINDSCDSFAISVASIETQNSNYIRSSVREVEVSKWQDMKAM